MISATIIADSINDKGNRLTTLKIVMPRYILAEFNTHRMISKNSASSRAIPFNKMMANVDKNPFIPYAWQHEHKGMQGNEYFTEYEAEDLIDRWLDAKTKAIDTAVDLHDGITYSDGIDSGDAPSKEYNIELTKQLCNRLVEPFMYHTVVCTATEWENFFNLRCPRYEFGNTIFRSRRNWYTEVNQNGNGDAFPHETNEWWRSINKGQADIHIMELAECIWDAMNESQPHKVVPGDWHLPYGDKITLDPIEQGPFLLTNKLKISTARLARISYETLGDDPKIDYGEDIKLHDRLLKADPVHASPAEHQGRAMTNDEFELFTKSYFVETISPQLKNDLDKKWAKAYSVFNGQVEGWFITEYGWCRNFRGFIPYRYLLENNMQL